LEIIFKIELFYFGLKLLLFSEHNIRTLDLLGLFSNSIKADRFIKVGEDSPEADRFTDEGGEDLPKANRLRDCSADFFMFTRGRII